MRIISALLTVVWLVVIANLVVVGNMALAALTFFFPPAVVVTAFMVG